MTTTEVERIVIEALWEHVEKNDVGISDVGAYRDMDVDVPCVVIKMKDGTEYQMKIVRRC